MDIADKRERLAPLLARLGEKTPPGMISVGPGWVPLVLELNERLAEIDPGYSIFQVKEKFGGLRFYAETSESYPFEGEWKDNPFFQTIHEYEARSYETCEDCGEPGSERGGSWIIVLCDACEAARDGDRKMK